MCFKKKPLLNEDIINYYFKGCCPAHLMNWVKSNSTHNFGILFLEIRSGQFFFFYSMTNDQKNWMYIPQGMYPWEWSTGILGQAWLHEPLRASGVRLGCMEPFRHRGSDGCPSSLRERRGRLSFLKMMKCYIFYDLMLRNKLILWI